MKKITVELNNLEAEALCFALGATAKDLNYLIQGCFNHPCPDGETPEHRLNLMSNFLCYRDAMDDVYRRVFPLVTDNSEQAK